VHGGLDPLRAVDVVTYAHQLHPGSLDRDPVRGNKMRAAGCGEVELVPLVLDQLREVVEGAGRILTGQ